MEKRKIVCLLKLLSVVEQRQFLKFMQSYHNPRDKSATLLYEYLLKNSLKKSSPKLSDERAFKHAFKGKVFKKETLASKCSDLVDWLERFLALNAFNASALERYFHLAQAYKLKKQDELFFEQLAKCEQILEALPQRDLWFYSWQMKLTHARYFHPNTQKYIKKAPKEMLADVFSSFDNFALLAKLRYGLEARNREVISGDLFSVHLWSETLKSINLETATPLAVFYLKILHLLENNAAINFEEVKEAFQTHIKLEGKEGQGALSTFLINHLAFLYFKSSDRAYLEKILELYELFLADETLEQEGYLSSSHFMNIGILGAELDKMDWTGRFIKSYKHKVKEEYREKSVNMVKAQMAFLQKELPLAIDLLNVIEFADVTDNLRVKTLLARCYFEQDRGTESRLFRSHCKAFDLYIQRQKQLGTQNKQPYLNFIAEIQRLWALFLKKDPVLIQLGLVNLRQQQSLICKDWLLGQYELLDFIMP